MSSRLVEDFMHVIANATYAEIVKRNGDTIRKRHRTDQEIGLQGMILDAMDDDDRRLTSDEARRLLLEIQKKLNQTGVSNE